jgi:nifR3 family TIM-barrel protein
MAVYNSYTERIMLTDILKEPFLIREVEIAGRVLLAPMDGYTDSPFRSMCRAFGASLCPSEFINGIDIVNGHPHLKYKLHFNPEERPFCYQVYDDDPDRLLNAAKILMRSRPDLLDINMGCSARKVSNRGAGAGLLRTPNKIGRIMSMLTQNLEIPITAKIRLGWDENSRNYLEIVRFLQDNGASAITVHARTRKQEYKGLADWNAIGEIKSIATVPIIGNGDVKSLEDAKRLIDQTGCDAVMIGRAALGNPWVFSGADRKNQSVKSILTVVQEHLYKMTSLYSNKIGTMLFRRHLARYLHDINLSTEQKVVIFAIEDPANLIEYLNNLMPPG